MTESKLRTAYRELDAAGEAVKLLIAEHPLDREALARAYERMGKAAGQIGDAVEDELPKLASTHSQLDPDSHGAEEAAQRARDARDVLTQLREAAYAYGDTYAHYAGAIRQGDLEKGAAAGNAVKAAETRMNEARAAVGELLQQ